MEPSSMIDIADPLNDVSYQTPSIRKISGAQMREARERMKKITSGDIDVSTIELPLARITHLRDHISTDLLRLITRQFGFTPLNLIDISYYHPVDNRPLILHLYPLNIKDPTIYQDLDQDFIPFPTIFWVSCPILHANISKLEMGGWIQKLTERLLRSEESSVYRADMETAHKLYASERWNSLDEDDKEFIEKSGWHDVLHDTGVAGMKNFASIKCLHTHYAHYVSRPEHGNIVGKWVQELLEENGLL